MKKFIRILGVFIAVVVITIVLLPFIFKGQIAEVVKTEANERLNAKVEFSGIKLSLIRSFPDMSVQINDLMIIGIDEFDGDTLANIERVYVSVKLMSMIKGSNYMVNSVNIDHPQVKLLTNKDGNVNWDIQKPSAQEIITDSINSAAPSSFTLTIKSLKINNGFINYIDDNTNTRIVIQDMDHSLSGDLTAISTTLETKSTIDDLTVLYNNIPYFVNSRIDLKADLEADLENYVFTLSDNILMINEVQLGLEGSVSIEEEGVGLDLLLNTKETAFKDILSLLPEIYQADFKEIKANGTFSIDGFLKGTYMKESYPSFEFNLLVADGAFNYPDLPSGIEDLNIVSNISNVGGSLDNTVIEVKKMSVVMAENPLNLTFMVKTPISDPFFNLKIDGIIDLQNIKNIYPLAEEEVISGKVITDLSFSGRLSAVDAGDTKNFSRHGFLEVEDLFYKSAEYPSGFSVHRSHFEVFKEHIDLKSFDFIIGSSDISATGRIENYLPYLFYGETMSGNFVISSKYMDLDELSDIESSPDTEKNNENLFAHDTISVDSQIILIPENIDFVLKSSFSELVYLKKKMKNVNGNIKIHNGEFILEDMRINMVGGTLELSGVYETRNPESPTIDLNVKLLDFNVQETYNDWAIMREYVPIVKKTIGTYTSGFRIKTSLDANLMPVFPTVSGAGDLLSSKILIEDIQVFNRLAELLKIDQFKNMMIDPLNLKFEFIEGVLRVKPFSFKMGKIQANLGGTTSFDKNINYVMSMKIPREMFGDSFNDIYQSLLGKTGDLASFLDIPFVNLDVIIGGTLDNPTLKTGLKESMEDIVEDLKNKAKEELEKKKKELEQKLSEEAEKYIAQAEAQAAKIMSEARARADDIKNLARQTADRIKYEADTNANKLIAEGKKNGFLAEVAAKAAASELKKEANVRANQIITEADKNADAILNKAQQQADAIVNEARERYKVKLP